MSISDRLRSDQPHPGIMREAADLFDAIDKLHYRVIHRPSLRAICRGCREFWPCTHHRLLHPEGDQ